MVDTTVKVPAAVSTTDPRFLKFPSNFPPVSESWTVNAFVFVQPLLTVKLTDIGSPAQNVVAETELIVIVCEKDGSANESCAASTRRKLLKSFIMILAKIEITLPEKGKKFHRIERNYGSFLRTFALPDNVDDSKVQAEFKDGVLNVRLRKAEQAKPRSIEVKVS